MSSMAYCARHVTTYLASTGCLDCAAMQGTSEPVHWLPKFIANAEELELKNYRRIIRWRLFGTGLQEMKLRCADIEGRTEELTYSAGDVKRYDLRALDTNHIYVFDTHVEVPRVQTQQQLPPQIYVTRAERRGPAFTLDFIVLGTRKWGRQCTWSGTPEQTPRLGSYLLDEEEKIRYDTYRERALFYPARP